MVLFTGNQLRSDKMSLIFVKKNSLKIVTFSGGAREFSIASLYIHLEKTLVSIENPLEATEKVTILSEFFWTKLNSIYRHKFGFL